MWVSGKRLAMSSRAGQGGEFLQAVKGELAALIRAADWSGSPLGPPSAWSSALRNTVNLILPAQAQIVLFWGPEFVALYNDAYAPTIGDKHPRALGRPARENWAELWGDLEPLLSGVRETGETFFAKDRQFYIERHGGLGETVYFDVSYSLVPEADGSPGGVLCIVSETTDRHRSEERVRLATENAGIGLWDIDPDGSIDFSYSRKNSSFVMARNERVPMDHLLAHLHPEDAPKFHAAYNAARDPVQRALLDLEYRILPADSMPLRWIKIRGRGVFDESGNCLRVSGTALEVTRERETQQALAQSEEQLRLATEHAEVGMWDVDNIANTLIWTKEVRAAFGVDAEGVVTMEDFYNGLHPDDREATSKAFADANDPEKRALYDVEYRTIGKNDGVIRWVHAKGRGVFDETGRCLRVTGTALDITRRKNAEERLRQNEELLRLATDNAGIGMWDMDVARNAYYSQPRVKAMFGIPPDENPPPDHFFSLVHKDDIQRVQDAYLAAFDPEKRAFYDVDYRVIGRDGVQRWVQARGRGVFDDGGNCLRVIGTALDITERKAIEERLHELNETLEQRVAERTEALERSQAALQQAQKMEAIGNLTGGIAHDFNNLLQGLTGSLDLIRRKPENVERVRRWAEAGLQAAERGAKLTAQLLAFSRAQKLEMRPLDVSALLDSMRELLSRSLGPSIHIVMDLSPEASAALGDETQLEMAVLNLAINARDAMDGTGELIIKTVPKHIAQDDELQPGDYLELSVTDTGCGMSAEVVARAFDPFFTTKDVGKGTGLGLSQVYGMARQAGGTVRIVSTPGRGTTIRILLRATSREAVTETAVARHHIETAARETILIVDDDPDVRQFLTDSLDTFGYKTIAAADGASGLDVLERECPDLMIVDYAMPGMTGAQLAALARTKHPDLPILFASGYAETTALENALDEKASILRKPFRLDVLQTTIAGILSRN